MTSHPAYSFLDLAVRMAIEAHGPATAAELKERFGDVPPADVQRTLDAMLRDGRLVAADEDYDETVYQLPTSRAD